MAGLLHHPAADPKSTRLIRLLVLLVVIVAANVAGVWLTRQIDFQAFSAYDSTLQAVLVGTALVYVLLMATPFMPGIEVGLALMFMLGSEGAVLVYACTVVALTISFTVGRRLSPRLVGRLLDWLHLRRAAALVRRLEPLNQEQRLALLNEKAPARIAPFLLQHRYLTIAAALNLPGNALIGGGGGIALAVGMSKIVPMHAFVMLVAVAVAPVPLWFFFSA